MKKILRLITILLAAAFLLSAGIQFGQAQGDEPPPAEPLESEDSTIQEAMYSFIPIQGRLTDASGNPLNGDHNLLFRFYDTPTGGSPLCASSQTVTLQNGLFSMNPSCGQLYFDGRQLYLGVAVDGGSEMTPRLRIYAVPYALSLKPGAVISNTTNNQHGLDVKSLAGGGLSGATLWVENTNTGSGIAAWVRAAGSDASLVIENSGSGELLKAFGGDGGEDELRISNNGSLQTKADTYLFVPASEIRPITPGAIINYYPSGDISLQYGTNGYKTVMFAIELPAVLYGQPVKIEEVTIYYDVSNSATFITQTEVYKQLITPHMGGGPQSVYLVDDYTDRKSTTYTFYSVTPVAYEWLDSQEGFISVALIIDVTNTTHYIDLGGVRVRLGHHPLY